MNGIMQGITLKAQLPGSGTWLDLSQKLSTYSAGRIITYDASFTTMDGEEVRLGKRERTQLRFTLLPCTGAELNEYYSKLRGIDGRVYLMYTDPILGASNTEYFWLDSEPFSEYMLKSVDNNVRYGVGEFVYKAVNANTYA